MSTFTNKLSKESSPYLLQHAHNPVNWFPWGEEAIKLAKEQDKLILVSIGYSSCHWCHVMERESFQNEQVAHAMNQNFINIKIDREERPDLDQIYMEAVQAMGIGGGWPLNVFVTPELKPVYGGTYFPPQQWMQILKQLVYAYTGDKREQLIGSGDQLTNLLNDSEIKKFNLSAQLPQQDEAIFHNAFDTIKKEFDTLNGGTIQVPKFPMPSIWNFVLNYHRYFKHQEALDQTSLTLEKMAQGGLLDQIQGGFARYSTDEHWFAPHFEKMLYDNGLLLSIYSKAYLMDPKPIFSETLEKNIHWLRTEMQQPGGGFYSALDADTDGEEGKFYTWTAAEIEETIPEEDIPLFITYYNLTPEGNWEQNRNILHKQIDDEAFASVRNISLEELELKKHTWSRLMLEKRAQRTQPGLDDKIILSWNAFTITGLCDAYIALQQDDILEIIEVNLDYLINTFNNDSRLYHTAKGSAAKIDAFLDDHAALMLCLIKAYQITFKIKYIELAKELADRSIKKFYDDTENAFFYSDRKDTLVRKKEIFDNVVPSSNSMMAEGLLYLSTILSNEGYHQIVQGMLGRLEALAKQEPIYLTNWLNCLLINNSGLKEVVIGGAHAEAHSLELQQYYTPNALYFVERTRKDKSVIPLFEGKENQDKETFYICENRTCKAPVHSMKEAKRLILDQFQ